MKEAQSEVGTEVEDNEEEEDALVDSSIVMSSLFIIRPAMRSSKPAAIAASLSCSMLLE